MHSKYSSEKYFISYLPSKPRETDRWTDRHDIQMQVMTTTPHAIIAEGLKNNILLNLQNMFEMQKPY